MSRKISQNEFLHRFYRNYPNARIEIVIYTAISNPLVIRCAQCQKELRYSRARDALNHFSCCSACDTTKLDQLMRLYDDSQEFEFVKKLDKDRYIVHHKVCGNDLTRIISNALDNPYACQYCSLSAKANMLSIDEAQQQLDARFLGSIQILDYSGQLKRNHYKCLKCGLIFVQRHTRLLQSRGCPKCD